MSRVSQESDRLGFFDSFLPLSFFTYVKEAMIALLALSLSGGKEKEVKQ